MFWTGVCDAESVEGMSSSAVDQRCPLRPAGRSSGEVGPAGGADFEEPSLSLSLCSRRRVILSLQSWRIWA